MSLKVQQLHAVISGRVQGVGFRFATRGKALSLGLKGWVRNLPNGGVEVLAEGDGGSIEALFEWLRQGPPGSRVDEVEVLARGETSAQHKDFDIRRG